MRVPSIPRALVVPAAIVLLLALAGVSAAAAFDALRWERRLERGDARYAVAVGDGAMWTPDTVLPESWSRALVGAADDVAYRRALRRFWATNPHAPIRIFADVAARSGAELELTRVERADSNPVRRSALANARGALAVEEARGVAAQRAFFLRRAADHFRRAVTLDRANTDAQYNLELVLRLLGQSGTAQGDGGPGRSSVTAPGAGAATAGSGY
jgi:hypothetical protein